MATVLVIEDSPTQALRMRIGLEQHGYSVIVVNNPVDATTEAAATSPDVVVSDVNMPRMSGFQVCEAFAADSRLSSIPVVLCSATATDEEDRFAALEAGARAFIEKGNDTSSLHTEIQKLIG